MICPHCHKEFDLPVPNYILLARSARECAQALGSIGGRTKGKTKARAVDYAAMARLSHQRRAENKAKQA